NTAQGAIALFVNTTGTANTADGFGALGSNTKGDENTATGVFALAENTAGRRNTADGLQALFRVTTGSFNSALGYRAGFDLNTGDHNIDIGNKGLGRDANTIRIGKIGIQTATFIAGISGATVAGGVGVVIDSNGQLGTVQSSARFKDDIKPMDKAS